jgi:hypothetical protein
MSKCPFDPNVFSLPTAFTGLPLTDRELTRLIRSVSLREGGFSGGAWTCHSSPPIRCREDSSHGYEITTHVHASLVYRGHDIHIEGFSLRLTAQSGLENRGTQFNRRPAREFLAPTRLATFCHPRRGTSSTRAQRPLSDSAGFKWSRIGSHLADEMARPRCVRVWRRGPSWLGVRDSDERQFCKKGDVMRYGIGIGVVVLGMFVAGSVPSAQKRRT